MRFFVLVWKLNDEEWEWMEKQLQKSCIRWNFFRNQFDNFKHFSSFVQLIWQTNGCGRLKYEIKSVYFLVNVSILPSPLLNVYEHVYQTRCRNKECFLKTCNVPWQTDTFFNSIELRWKRNEQKNLMKNCQTNSALCWTQTE